MAQPTQTNEIEELRSVLVSALRPYASRIEVFGSVARGEAGAGSDVDVLVRLRPSEQRPPMGLRWFALEQELADRLGRPVELVTERALSPHVRPHVQTDRVLLYEDE
jgi:hypothetical protein